MAESLKATASKTEAKSEKPASLGRGVEVTTLPDSPQLQLMELHQTYGNMAIQRWLASGALQTAPGDAPEVSLAIKDEVKPGLQTPGLYQLAAFPDHSLDPTLDGLLVKNISVKPEENDKIQRQADEEIQTQGQDEELQKQSEAEEPIQGQDEKLQKQGEEEGQIQSKDEELQKQGEAEDPIQGQDQELQKQDEAEVQTQREEELQTQIDEEVQMQPSIGSVQFAAKRTDPYASPEVLNTIRTQRGQGEPLEGGLQFQMERSLGADFSAVRVHRDANAARLNGMLSARAFTNRNDIYFNQGQYNPQSRSGQHLIAHELSHVVQQRNIPDLQSQLQDPGIRNQYEREANSATDQAVYGINTAPQGQIASLPSPTVKNAAGGSLQLAAENQGSETAEPLQFGFLDALTNPIEWAKEKVKPYLRQIPGYDLLALIIGKDPLSGTPVERNGPSIVKAVVGLIPGGAAFLENLTKTGVIARAAEWFGEEFAKLNLGWEAIKSIFSRAIDAAKDAIPNIPKAIENAKNVFMEPIKRIFNFIKTVGPKLMEFIFEGALALAGAPVKMIMGILNKGKDVLRQIITNPIGFLGNLVNAIKGGLGKFVGNIVAHLQSGLAGWLFGAISNIGLVLPKKLDLAGIFHIIAQILGVTWRAIRGQIVKRLGPTGEKIMSTVEKSISFVTALITKGPLALLEQAKEFLGELKSMFFDSLIEWLRNTIIVKAITKLISMFNPAGAIIQAVMTIYSTIQFFIERAQQIAAFVGAVFNSIAEIAGGNIGKAIAAVENSLAKALPVAISFLANFIGLGGIAAKVKAIIAKIRKPIDKAIGKVVEIIVRLAKKAWAKIVGAGKAVGGAVKDVAEKVVEWWKTRKSFVNAGGEKHTLFFRGEKANAKLMIASEIQQLDDYIAEKEKQANNNPEMVSKLNSVKTIMKKVIEIQGKMLSAEAKKEKENLRSLAKDLTSAMTELTTVLAKLNDNSQKPGADEVEYKYGSAKPTLVTVRKLHKGNKKPGSATGSSDHGTTGWQKIVEAGLTTITNKWVQMHIINDEKFGGEACAGNLIPGPHSINRGAKQSRFDNTAAELLKKDNVIWIDGNIHYYSEKDYEAYVKTMNLEAGLHLPEDNKWDKRGPANLKISIEIPKPPFGEKNVINLSECTATELLRTGLDIFTSKTYKRELVYFIKGNTFDDIDHFKQKLINHVNNSKKISLKDVNDIVDRIENLYIQQMLKFR